MKRIPLAERKLPNYTRGEELFHMISHITGSALGLVALALCLCVSIIYRNPYGVLGGIIFSLSMILLYTMSSIYHGLRPGTAKKIFQIIDHCTIYLLIAGTYSPVCFQMIRLGMAAKGWLVFSIVWALAIIGITLNAIDLKRYRHISMFLYLGMGWCIIGLSSPSLMVQTMGVTGTRFMLAGGIAYSVGAIFYGVGHKKKYMHSVFHIFCVLGSLLHVVSVLCFLG
ncbi:MAG: hemolysin III family protein [Lachnospiraceae bacterium]|nr:hemolysin III family protein [Lachnospiraceae bacterium]